MNGHQSVQFSIQSDDPLTRVEIEPYLALNLSNISIQLPRHDNDSNVLGKPLHFKSDIDWTPPKSLAIVVDDLDPGFSVTGQTPTERQTGFNNPLAWVLPMVEKELDAGLAVAQLSGPRSEGWKRVYDSASYGRYRHTHSKSTLGSELTYARFIATLPQKGSWKLDYYVPEAAFFMNRRTGTIRKVRGVRSSSYYQRAGVSKPSPPEERYILVIKDGHSKRSEIFDITQARVGWNEVGTFLLRSTDVEVLVNDFAGHGDIEVFADAIRWIPISPSEAR